VEYAKEIGLIDDIIIQDGCTPDHFTCFHDQIVRVAEKLAHRADFAELVVQKRQNRAADEKAKPLQQYRMDELEEMNQNFWGEDPAYHIARTAFVRKMPRPGNQACSPALMSLCKSGPCDKLIQANSNRCAFASTSWTRQRTAAMR
jgi:putative two-component system hydrogenase maturation factor HypX/HoxX